MKPYGAIIRLGEMTQEFAHLPFPTQELSPWVERSALQFKSCRFGTHADPIVKRPITQRNDWKFPYMLSYTVIMSFR